MEIEEIPGIGIDCKRLIDGGLYDFKPGKLSVKFTDRRVDNKQEQSHVLSITFPRDVATEEIKVISDYYYSRYPLAKSVEKPQRRFFLVAVMSENPEIKVGRIGVFTRKTRPPQNAHYYDGENRKFLKVRWEFLCYEDEWKANYEAMKARYEKMVAKSSAGAN